MLRQNTTAAGVPETRHLSLGVGKHAGVYLRDARDIAPMDSDDVRLETFFYIHAS